MLCILVEKIHGSRDQRVEAWVGPLTTGGLCASSPINSGHDKDGGHGPQRGHTLARGCRKGSHWITSYGYHQDTLDSLSPGTSRQEDESIVTRVIGADHQEVLGLLLHYGSMENVCATQVIHLGTSWYSLTQLWLSVGKCSHPSLRRVWLPRAQTSQEWRFGLYNTIRSSQQDLRRWYLKVREI